MKKLTTLALTIALATSCATTKPAPAAKTQAKPKATQSDTGKSATQQALDYPQAKRQDVVDKIFGQAVHDPYRWLEDAGDKKVQTWMHAEDELARNYLTNLPGHDAIAKRLRKLFYLDVLYAPEVRGGRYFYRRRLANKEKAVFYWKQGADGKEHVLLDPNAMSKDGSVSVSDIFVAWDGKKVAYRVQKNNADAATLYVMDVGAGPNHTNKVRDVDTIDNAKYAYPSWTPDSKGFYYTYLPETSPDGKKLAPDVRPGWADVRFHKLGTDPKKDPVVHQKTGDARDFLGADISRDGRWLMAYIWHGWNRADVYYRDLKSKDTAWKPLITGTQFTYEVSVWKNNFYILTDEGAPHKHLFKVSAEAPAHKNWKEIVPADKDRVLNSAQIIGGKLVLSYLDDAHSAMDIRDLDGTFVRKVKFPTIGSTFGVKGDPDRDEAYYSFSSFTTPREIFKTSISTGKTKLWEKVKVPVDPSPYTVEQKWYKSKDGTKVSMFIVHRKDIKLDGSTPFLLYGYGGFDVNMTPYFRSSIYVWLDAGGGYAVPNLRGGGEYGESWHKDGMLHKKQNVFDDFIAAAQYLVDEGYTSPKKLAISGGSNGGLLVGAVMTQRPDLFGAVVCAVPLLDMVRYAKFGSGKTWELEYGDPTKKDDFKYLYAYSPYHHVQKGTDYPALLMLSADSDDRVDPMHARKFTAAVQYATSSNQPVLLRIEKNAGHTGGDMIKKYVAEYASQYAFLMHELGVEPPTSGSSSRASK